MRANMLQHKYLEISFYVDKPVCCLMEKHTYSLSHWDTQTHAHSLFLSRSHKHTHRCLHQTTRVWNPNSSVQRDFQRRRSTGNDVIVNSQRRELITQNPDLFNCRGTPQGDKKRKKRNMILQRKLIFLQWQFCRLLIMITPRSHTSAPRWESCSRACGEGLVLSLYTHDSGLRSHVHSTAFK